MRQEGYYWVKLSGENDEWSVAEWRHGHWWIPGNEVEAEIEWDEMIVNEPPLTPPTNEATPSTSELK